jgi:hypothetical protein
MAAQASTDDAEVGRLLQQLGGQRQDDVQTAASALRRRIRASPATTAGQLVRLTPAWSEVLRAWETLHESGNRSQDAAAPLLGAVADVLWVRPGEVEEAASVLHVALDGLARAVRAHLKGYCTRSDADCCWR